MAHARIPATFQPLLRSEMEAAIKEANLGRENTEIARLYLLDHVSQIEIAVEFGYDRSTITHRMRQIIRRVEQAAERLTFT